MVDGVCGGVSSGSRLTGVPVSLPGVRRGPIRQYDHRSSVRSPINAYTVAVGSALGLLSAVRVVDPLSL